MRPVLPLAQPSRQAKSSPTPNACGWEPTCVTPPAAGDDNAADAARAPPDRARFKKEILALSVAAE
jgi:hypothetical protein